MSQQTLHTQYTLVAEWSQKIDSKSYTHLFSLVSRQGAWSRDAETAWSVMTDDTLPQLQIETATVSRSWLSSNLHSRLKQVRKNTRHMGIKDDAGNLIIQLAHSGSPIKEFSETAYREKGVGLDLKKPWVKETPPMSHECLMALAFLIFDLNKCAVAMTELNVKECNSLTNVCKSICRHSDDHLNLLESLPMGAVENEFAKINQKEVIFEDKRKEGESHKQLVESMKTIEDLRVILVQLVTAANSESGGHQMSGQCHTIAVALDNFKWHEFKAGKNIY